MSENAASVPGYFATGWTGGRNPWVIAAVVTMATFMEILDTSIANVALPSMAGNLGVGRNETTWVLTSYLVANAIVVPMSGWFASRLGRKRFYMTCVALFTLASLLCGVAPSLEWLVFFRVLQGLAGGGLGPCEQAILVDTFPPEKRGTALALYGMTAVLAPAIGPTVGGIITDHFSWRWVFLINIPLGLLSLVLTSRVVSDPPHIKELRARGGRVDWLGFGLIAICLGAFELVLEKGQTYDWFDSRFITVATLVAVASFLAFVVWELRHDNPVLDLKLFKNRDLATANVLMVGCGFLSYGATVVLPPYLQALMGYTAQQAGMVLSPGGLTIALLLPFVGRIVPRVDPRAMITFGFACVGLSLLHAAGTLNLGMDFGSLLELRVLQCLGFAFLFVPIQAVAYARISPLKFNQVSSLMNLSRNVGADMGIAFLVTLIYRGRQTNQVQLIGHTTAYDAVYRQRVAELAALLERAGTVSAEATKRATKLIYEQVIAQSMHLAYLDAIRGLAAVALVMVPLAWLVQRRAAAPGTR